MRSLVRLLTHDHSIVALASFFCLQALTLQAQTTQGLISGRILNSVTGRPVSGATVGYRSATLSAGGTLKSDEAGYYFLPLLSAGTYTVRASGADYQPQELQQLELAVAGRIQLDFRLRPLNDVWESGQYRSVFLPGTKTIVTFYGPDVDSSRSGSFESQKGQRGTLDTSASYVIDPIQIGDLPLPGRDVYSILVGLPTVAADSGTGRGLGISVAGQRPSSSNFLLDGVENNNYLVTGPLSPVAPEAVQEYRVSTNNYSAEYGRTAGFIANAVTRAGGMSYHGIGYEYLKNTALNAADFGDNLIGLGRRQDVENQFGYQAGGPLIPRGGLRTRLFFSSSLEQLFSHSRTDPQTYKLLTTNFIPALNIPSTRLSRTLLEKYPGPVIEAKALTADYTTARPVVVERTIALERFDYATKGGRDHFMGRLALARFGEPYFFWTPYPDFTSGINQHTTGVAGNWQRSWTPRLTSELKASYSDDNLWWDRAHPEVPTLGSSDGTTLPGSQALYAYRNHNRSTELIYSTVWTRNRHVLTAGAGLLARANSGYLTELRDGEYQFSGVLGFALDQPNYFYAGVDRLGKTLTQPNYDRNYRLNQSFLFVQDSFRVSPRLTLNFGFRYERFGSPKNTGSNKDAQVLLGAGANFPARIASATLAMPGSGDQQLFAADNKNFAPRFGFSWDPLGKSKTIVRGGFGIYYDRLFDNLWQNTRLNNIDLNLYQLPGSTTNYLQPISTVLPTYQKGNLAAIARTPSTLVDPKLRNGYTETFFLGVQQSVGDNLSIEVNGTGALGRRLITSDFVNRDFSKFTGEGYNSSLPKIIWRSSQGLSDYYAMSALVRYRVQTLFFQASYTLSHSIDNQSDPLVGEFADLNISTINGGGANIPRSSFVRQFDSRSDRGNSAFDQRHNLFLLGIWQPDSRFRFARNALLRDWKVSWMAAFRTGTPYTVLSQTFLPPDDGGSFENQRADLVKPNTAVLSQPKNARGGVYLLNPAAFAVPDPNRPGNTARNAFRGPGLYNADVSLARSFRLPGVRLAPLHASLKEGLVLTLRADAFNILNHANLGNPDNLLGSPAFGLATFGRQGTASGFPAVTPLNETARQFQLLVRLSF
jgi:hypothetical protein